MTDESHPTKAELFAQIAEALDTAVAGMGAQAAGLKAAQAGFEMLAAIEEVESRAPANGHDTALTTEQKAKELNIAPQTLRRLRHEGKDPPSFKVGRAVRYLKGLPPPEQRKRQPS